jgi:hypothetical protein
MASSLLISEFLANPSGNDLAFEYVELIATQTIDFSVTPYSIIFANNGTATSAGWIAGGSITYGFSITSGIVNAGDVVYVGGSSLTPTGTKLRTINVTTTNGDRFGNLQATTGVLGNGGSNADGIAVFDININSITNANVPIDAIFFGTGIGTAVVSGGTAGYELPVNDLYNGGKLQTTSFLAPDPASAQVTIATGTYSTTTGSFTTNRTWANSATATATSAITIASAPTVNLSVTPDPVTEAAQTSITVTATASSAVTNDQTVTLTISGSNITTGDYTLNNTTTNSVTITILNGQTTGTATFKVVDDALVEGTETATLTISNPSSGVTLGSTTSQNITITDNDSATPTSLDLANYVRIGRYNLPIPARTPNPPTGSELALEVSAITYNPVTGNLFVLGDEGTAIVEINKKGQLVSSMTLTTGDFNDTEGLTYVANGQFVLVEERLRQASLFTYTAGGILSRANVQTVNLGTDIGNIGLEGLSFDPQSNGYIFVKEVDPQGIFQTTLDFSAGTASNGSSTTENSTNLFNPSSLSLKDIADVFALSVLEQTNGNLLVLGQEDGKVLEVNRSGNILSTLTITADPGNPLTITNHGFEGVTVDNDDLLYLTSESGGGDGDHPQMWVYAPSNYTFSNAAPVAVSVANGVTTLLENVDTNSRIKLGNIIVSDDSLGTNTLSVSDTTNFEIVGNELFLKAGTVLNFATQPSYTVTIAVEDATLGNNPDATTTFTLELQDTTGSSDLIISEIAPWSSGNSSLGSDWFEVTNKGTTAIDITGWKIDDDSASFASGSAISGVNSIAPGQSVVFVDGDTAKITAFINLWFGGTAPNGFAIGTYSGPGLGTGGDGVNLFNAAGVIVAGSSFGASPATSPFATFDNAAGSSTVSSLSVAGTKGAFSVIDATDGVILTGSPGTTTGTPTLSTTVGIVATGATASENGPAPGQFTILRTGDTTNALGVTYSIGSGSGNGSNGIDYTAINATTTTIPAGQSQVTIAVTPIDDNAVESTESVVLTLASAANYSIQNGASSATVTIQDNDTALPNFNLQVTEIWPGNSTGSQLTTDWFEITNTGTEAWVSGVGPTLYYDDDSQSPAEADLISGLTQLDPGEAAIIVIGNEANAQTFRTVWGSVINLTGVEVGYTDGAGLGANGDGVSLFVGLPATGSVPVDFEAYPTGSVGRSYDLNLAVFSVAGQNGAVATAVNNGGQAAIGSPGNGSPITKINVIQGSGDASPLASQTVTLQAIVVGDFQTGDADNQRNLNGFYVQEEDGDADGNPLTSEGLFIFDGSSPSVAVNVGDKVQITGTISEFFGETQLTPTTITVISSSNVLPTAANITLPTATTTLSQGGTPQPDLEAFEGMLVNFTDTLTVTEMFNLDRFNEIKLAQGDRPVQFTQNNDPDVAGFAAHRAAVGARTITYDDGLNLQNQLIGNLDGFGPTFSTASEIRMGDTITGLSGVLSYQWAGNAASGATWRARSTQNGKNTFTKVNDRPASPEDVGGSLKVTGFNVLNYFKTIDLPGVNTVIGQDPRGADNATEFERQTDKLVTALLAIDADVLGLVELENDFLPGSSGNAIEFLVNELNAVGAAGTYAWIDPGTQFVGNDAIAVGLIYKPGAVNPVGDVAILNTATFLDPNNTGQNRNRPAVAQTFEDIATGGTFTAVVNHLKSKGADGASGADLDQNDGQGAWNDTRAKASQALVNWLNTNPTGANDLDYLLMGDFNAYAQEDPVEVLEDAGYVNLASHFGGGTATSYVFDGQVGTLDYAFASASLFNQVTGATEWGINSDEADALDYNLDFGRDPAIADLNSPVRTSDHDPVIVGLNLADEFDVTTPTDGNATANTVAENAANGDLVGITASATDGDGSNNTVTYNLTDNAGGRFTINSTTGVVSVADASLLNFETAQSHNITVRATSSDGSTSNQTFAITVTDVNEAPTALSLTNTTLTIAENISTTNRIKVGDINITDDALGTETITLTGADAASFEILNNALYIKAGTKLDYETKNSYNITVNVDDPVVGNNPDASVPFTLSIIQAPKNVQDSQLVTGTPGNDLVIAQPNSVLGNFDGTNELLFTGAGNDKVDVTMAGELAGNNNIFTGSGNDIIDVANGDRAFGGSGDDNFDATDVSGYRISGGAGKDVFSLGKDGYVLGGDDNDTFYVNEGGGNIISGGAGTDEFWILTDNPTLLTSPNTITDFIVGTDVLGVMNQGPTFDFSDLSFSGNDILVNGKAIATLSGIATTGLTTANFVFK